ncbi:MAG: endonuclease/exonuclease/phosphatase family protein, partial [Chloroflexi bacterium]|nr:endonuclease/exonuclease/phosphatase family protein [Chloroflexota bacterium]
GAQVALVQEAVPPLELDRHRAVYGEIAGHRNWGSAVVALDPAVSIESLRSVRIPWSRRRYLLTNTHPGSVAIARLTVPGIQPITLVSVYGVMDGSVVSTMLRVVADLVPLFDSPYGARVILAGDLNVSTATKDPKHRARAEAVFAAIRSLGLVEAKRLVAAPPASSADCPCGDGGRCTHLATWGRAELDHVFVSPSLAGQVTALSADPAPVEAGLSDHVPLVLDLALFAERTPHTWDEESFADEIGRRHGAGARDVVEQLVNWADHKERELASAAGVRTKTLTRFPTNGCTTEPELWLQVDLDLEPKGIQYTISVRARGDVVVQFGNMRHPPFDTEAARDELRVALNTIAGVDIPAGQLRRLPTFPLAVLADPANLLGMVAVLDRIATESHTASAMTGVPSHVTTATLTAP